ncbi:anhydro-N-acetylmuramic acid kinase [Magnetofaba australis]|uniref:Anhydro-N-acetylmuramic acid kinase n=1 Tax=Magnetofaba australis IT-1 TaxID=1434232 RepID=A0A1Y2K6K6_9PROT|nr:anhydro-N-acetylmuramic acid kinase [Magnetofaba australis]OSM05269.1 putative anhydro-N-acetylmuramic acid kinase [Magnetofaba australis IT-1]
MPQAHNDAPLVIGLMSGTSADGIDAALIRTTGEGRPQPIAYLETPHPAEIRDEILALQQSGPEEIERLGEMSRRLAERFAEAATALCRQADVRIHDIALIGCHGQTIRHRPPHFSLQIGSAAIIAARTGVTTVSDFRTPDMALGGEGAPLAPYYHQALFADASDSACDVVVNLGGIANVTLLQKPPAPPIVAGDTGPANALMDELSMRLSGGLECCDRDGQRAAAGAVDAEALAWLMAHPYLKRPLPKSTGKEDFSPALLDRWLSAFPAMGGNDGVATLLAFTTQSIAEAILQAANSTPERIILCGGGANNPALRRQIAARLPSARILTSAELGVDHNAMEAEAFAWLAMRALRGLPTGDTAVTGAHGAAILGSLSPGGNWRDALALAARLNAASPAPTNQTV